MELTHTHELEFSLRDWSKGSNLLARLGFNDENMLSDSFDLTLEDEDEEDMLLSELNSLDLEFRMSKNDEEFDGSRTWLADTM